MYRINEDNSIYSTRGDIVILSVSADNNGKPYTFQAGEVLRIKVFGKKDAESVVLQKDFPITSATQAVELFLDENDTKIGEVISKPKDYWYEIELNPFDNPQTIIGYDEDGPKIFKLFPEGADIPPYVPDPEDIPVIDTELDMTSDRPISNQVIARAFANLQAGYQATHDAVAKLHITPQMYGAIGDGEADDTEAIKLAISAIGKNGISTLHFPTGTYLVSEDIALVSNMTVTGDGYNSVIKRIGTEGDHYNVIACTGTDNVTIKNIHIQGERNEHIGDTGEWGMCIGLRGSKNTTIKECKLTDAWGDGVYVGSNDNTPCTNTIIENCIIDNNRRQGISVINSDRLIVKGCSITNTEGTLPEAGIDFEANNSTDICTNNIVENCIFYGNNGGSIAIGNHIIPYEVIIRNCTSTDYKSISVFGTSVEGVSGGYLTVQNCIFKNSSRCVAIEGKSASGLFVRISNCELYASGSNGVCIEYTSDAVDVLGGLRVYGCSLDNPNSSVEPIRIINNKTGGTYNDIIIDVVVERCNKYCVYTKGDVTGSAIVNIGKKRTLNASFNLEQYAVFNSVDVKCESAARTITCRESFPYNCPVTVRKISGTYALQIWLEKGKFPQYSGDDAFELKHNYDEITLIHEAEGVWSVTDNTVHGATVSP